MEAPAPLKRNKFSQEEGIIHDVLSFANRGTIEIPAGAIEDLRKQNTGDDRRCQ